MIGVVIGLGLLTGVIVFLWLRKRRRMHLDTVSQSGKSTPAAISTTSVGKPLRQISQISSAGLLAKEIEVGTGGSSICYDQYNDGSGLPTTKQNSTYMTTDQRLNPWAFYSRDKDLVSKLSLQDSQDYSRKLSGAIAYP